MKDKIVLWLMVFAFIVGVISMLSAPVVWWDEGVYSGLGWNLKDDPFDYAFKHFGDNIGADANDPNWQQAGFRAPLLSYTIGMVYWIFGNNELLVRLIVPFFGAIGVGALYILAKKIFDKKVALFSSIILTLMPFYAYYGGKILTDVFSTTFVIISMLFFWMGFEEGNNKYKVLCGLFCGLAILARYTSVLIPIALILYSALRGKLVKYLKNKWTIAAVLAFFLVLTPWFYYSFNAYGDPLGFIWHGKRAQMYWTGGSPWHYLFQFFPDMYSLAIVPFLLGIWYFAKKFSFSDKKMFLVLWFLIMLLFVTFLMDHKEDRFLIATAPSLAILAAYGGMKFDKRLMVIVVVVILLHCAHGLYNQYSTFDESGACYLDALSYVREQPQGSILSYSNPVSYFYAKKDSYYLSNEAIVSSVKPAFLLSSNYDGSDSFPQKGIEVFSCGETKLFRID